MNCTSTSAYDEDRHDKICIIVTVTLCVRYPDNYPDVLPQLFLRATDDNVDDSELDDLLQELSVVVCFRQ